MDSRHRIPEMPRGMDGGKPGFEPYHVTIHQRLIMLAIYARRAGRLLTTLTFISAILALLAFGALGIMVAQALADGSIDFSYIFEGMDHFSIFALIGILAFVSLASYTFGCMVAALIYSLGLYQKYMQQTSSELQNGEFGLIIASEDLWQRLTERLQTGFFRQVSKVPYRGLERHLMLCVAHWASIRQIGAGKKFSRFKLGRGQQDFNQLIPFYKPRWWNIALMVILGLLLAGYLLVLVPLFLVLHGSRYIIYYARLTALAEFYLGEQAA